MANFRQLFFKYYDSKIASGEITFSKLGISKTDFTNLCTNEEFVPDREILERICERMNLTDEQRAELLEKAGR